MYECRGNLNIGLYFFNGFIGLMNLKLFGGYEYFLRYVGDKGLGL